MTSKKKADQQASPNKMHSHHINPAHVLANAPTKASRVLAFLLLGNSLNRFEAERLGDHCLNSTISRFSNDNDLQFQRTSEQVPNAWGEPRPVTRYRLLDCQREKALAVLALMLSKAPKRKEAA